MDPLFQFYIPLILYKTQEDTGCSSHRFNDRHLYYFSLSLLPFFKAQEYNVLFITFLKISYILSLSSCFDKMDISTYQIETWQIYFFFAIFNMSQE